MKIGDKWEISFGGLIVICGTITSVAYYIAQAAAIIAQKNK